TIAKQLVVGVPRRLFLEVSLHPESRPRVQLALDQFPGGLRLQAQRVAAQVRAEPPVWPGRNVEPLAIAAQRVVGVEVQGEVLAGRVVVSRHERNCPFSSPRTSKAVPASKRSRTSAERSGIDSISRPGSASPSGKG